MDEPNYDNKRPGGLNTTMIALVGAISVLLFSVLFVATETWFYNQDRRLTEEGWKRGNPQLEAYLAEQDKMLSEMRNVPGRDDRVAVPLDFAIEQYARSVKEAEAQ